MLTEQQEIQLLERVERLERDRKDLGEAIAAITQDMKRDNDG